MPTACGGSSTAAVRTRAGRRGGVPAVRLRPLDPRLGDLSLQAAVGSAGGAAAVVHDPDEPAPPAAAADGRRPRRVPRRFLAAPPAGGDAAARPPHPQVPLAITLSLRDGPRPLCGHASLPSLARLRVRRR